MTFARANHHRNGATIEANNAAAAADRQYKAAQRDYGDDSIKCRNMATAIDGMRKRSASNAIIPPRYDDSDPRSV